MRKIICCLLACFILHQAIGQSNVKIDIRLGDNAATKTLSIDTAGVVKIDTLDGILQLDLPDTLSNWAQYSIQFNNDSTKFTLSTSGCTDPKSCMVVSGEDISSRKIFLFFQKGQLVAMGPEPNPLKMHTLSNSRPVPIVHPYVKIVHQKPATPKPATPKLKGLATDPDDPNQRILALGDTSINAYKFDCPDTCGSHFKFAVSKKQAACCDPEVMESIADVVFRAPCLDQKGRALSINYIIVNDTRAKPSIPTPLILQVTPGGGFDYLKVIAYDDFRPRANQGITIAIIRPNDTLYTVNSVGVDNFLSQAGSFGIPSALTAGALAATPATTVKATPGKDNSGPIAAGHSGPTTNVTPPAITSIISKIPANADTSNLILLAGDTASLPTLSAIATYVRLKNLPTGKTPPPEYKSADLLVIQKKGNESLAANATTAYRNIFDNVRTLYAIQKREDSAKKQPVEGEKPIDSTTYYRNSLAAANAKLAKKLSQITLKAKLMGLYASLVRFNARYASIDLRESKYAKDRGCLLANIDSLLNVPVGATDSIFGSFLTQEAQTTIDSAYFADFAGLIADVRSQYALAISKTPTTALYYYSPAITVPKSDSVDITIKKQNNTGTPINLSYPVWGGWKIDFSTGFFVNGIRDVSFALGQHTYRYKTTSDTVLPSGTDSIRYGGSVKDTTGNLIHSNSSKLSYAIGVLAHVYQRRGGDINWGGVVGIMLDNNSKVLLVTGGSLMFRAGKNRIALTAGGILGQQQSLTSVNSQYVYNAKTQPDYTVYNSVYNVPRFYTGSNEITTNTIWKLSWFFGVTYNITVN